MSNSTHLPRREWPPFRLAAVGTLLTPPDPIDTETGVADRIRTVAFAELQAREAFKWAADRFLTTAAPEVIADWKALAVEEDRHYHWLLTRMGELGIDPSAKPVGDQLWQSLVRCETAEQFAGFVASAEERGRKAGARFEQVLKSKDPETARIFGKIAHEETHHVQLAIRHFPEALNWVKRGSSGT
ncbi:MAG: DUF455 family protein [Bdellovibrionota bacterium]